MYSSETGVRQNINESIKIGSLVTNEQAWGFAKTCLLTAANYSIYHHKHEIRFTKDAKQQQTPRTRKLQLLTKIQKTSLFMALLCPSFI
jgi:hypothetical protein